MTQRRRFALQGALGAVALLVGCAGAEAVHEPGPPVSTYFWTDEPQLVGSLSAAVEALAAATGRADVTIDATGVPVVYGDDMFNPRRGDFDCARTEYRMARHTILPARIRLDATPDELCMPSESQLLHEAIHALAPEAEHTETGVFSERGSTDGVVDAESLARLCEHFACPDQVIADSVGTGPE